MKFLTYILIIVCTSLQFSCEKVKYYPDKAYGPVETKFLVHRGSGNSSIQENTLEAAQFGFAQLDGIEVDLQLSKDRTIWLSHGSELEACGSLPKSCFTETTDATIIQLDTCMGNYDFSKLEDVFQLMASTYPDKHISLDVKGWYPCKASSLNVRDGLNILAEEIIRLTRKYNRFGFVKAESETATFLNYIRKREPGIETYLTTLGDFERGIQLALKEGYSGLSFKYKFKEQLTADHIWMMRKKGLKIQLWTVNDIHDLKEALFINPDFIQTDEYKLVQDSL